MNEFDDIDRELAAAFTQRPSTLSRPSLRDVKQRARRHQRQRSAGVLGACAVFGVGGVAVIAQRSPSNETTVGGLEGDPTTTMCLPNTTIVVDETMPYTIPTYIGTVTESTAYLRPGSTTTTTATAPADFGDGIAGSYVLAEGDFPGSVAEMFQVTVAALDAVNRDVNGYGGFVVGTVINIPYPGGTSTPATLAPISISPTTTTGIAQVSEVDCYGQTPWLGYWRCSGAVGAEGPYSYFDVCEPVSNTYADPTVPPLPGPGLIKIGTSIQVANCSNQEGVARIMSNQLAAEGFTTAEPDTCTIDLPITKVIYNPDDPLALPVAQTLSLFLGNAVVEPSGPQVPTLTLGTWAPGSGVIVLLGDDLAGKSLAQINAQINPSTTTLWPTSTSA